MEILEAALFFSAARLQNEISPPPKKRSPCRKRSPAKGVWQKSDGKSDRSVRKSDRKVTESVPKTEKVIELLLPHSFCVTLKRIIRYEKRFEKHQNDPKTIRNVSEGFQGPSPAT